MTISVLLCALLSCVSPNQSVEGAWAATFVGSKGEVTMIFSGGFFAVSEYDSALGRFDGTWGGSFKVTGSRLLVTQEFNTIRPGEIGLQLSGSVQFKKSELQLTIGPKVYTCKRLDNGKPGALAGAWWMTGRMRDGKLVNNTPGVRRTMKILSGTRFQWIAYNVETKEFFGTGGGSYTTTDGKYTEQLAFFSRDNSRVGASLSFDYSIEEGRWRHRGLSSKGEPIDEFWSRRD